ncbi:IS256 family transposase [Clostridium sporogenes]|uniref:IS256 family transposase n=1 Tax=Clostridium sporogenes TaxID=1509 RepID=UPI00024BA023|nr:IS256 family transposase [Clostridium sporogenes]EHN13407.1 transposase, mutator type [Clostridium sporogenes PA 3679]MDU4598529.1 IS256 family transposase [Clostridium sporogenes]NFQ33544.1 IS256 family transposase [Clostridium sporogenes]NFQ61188.1 IS256 family transposase [Clostridium sporogenes]NFU09089.1 IS256 family transposase [Clostridium sporogenes]
MSFSRKELIKQLIKETKPTSAKDVQETLKDLFADTLKEMLEAELDDHLGYSKYDYKNKNTTNSRNGRNSKRVLSDLGEFDLTVPRDREGSFQPQVVKKNQTDISGIEDQVIGMYAKGMTTRDIATHLENIYGFEASPTLISGITDKITPVAKEWQNRPLEPVYPIIFMDAIHYKVKQDNRVINKAAYAVIGVNLDGIKEVLGIWIGGNETSKYWLLVLNELKNRGVNDILIACVDGLNGFTEAIKAIYPHTEIQRCIIHQIRNSSKYVSYKDLKEFNADLKLVYTATTEEAALAELERFEQKWGDKYLIAIRLWKNNWDELATFFKYPKEIRKIIYTTNAMESYNRQLRKVTKARSIFPSDDALLKMLYLATMDISKKWTQSIRGWAQILAQLSIFFEGRIDNILF